MFSEKSLRQPLSTADAARFSQSLWTRPMILQKSRSLPFIPAFGRILSVPVFQGAAMTGGGAFSDRGFSLRVRKARKGPDPFDILRDRGYNLGGRTR